MADHEPFLDMATETTLAALLARFATTTSIPDNMTPAPAFRLVGQDTWSCSFADVGSVISPELQVMASGTGVAQTQGGGNLLVQGGTTANAEWLARSKVAWRSTMNVRHSMVASARIANTNFLVMLADLVGENLACTINSATSISVAFPAHGFTAANIGQFMFVGGIAGANGVPGRWAIASIPNPDTINFTVSAWPATGSCTVDLFGHSYVKTHYDGAVATAAKIDAQRRGWASGDTAIATLTTAAPGHIVQTEMRGREIYWSDFLRASVAGVTAITARGSRLENLPDDNRDLYLFLWCYNGSVAPASNTTWTIGFLSVERYVNNPVTIQSPELQAINTAVPVNIANSVTAGLLAGAARVGFMAGAGIWYDDTSTLLAANATFTGTSRDATVTATATAMANAATYAKEIRISAETDVAGGTLWLEVSRDNVTFRRVKAVTVAAVTGGGFAAEIVHRPSWRYWRGGFTNGGTVQTRLAVNSLAMAA